MQRASSPPSGKPRFFLRVHVARRRTPTGSENSVHENIISVTGGYYPSPGIDFEVLGVKLDRAGVNSRRGEVGCVTV